MKAVLFDLAGVLKLPNGVENPELLDIVQELQSRGIQTFILSNNFSREPFSALTQSFDKSYFAGETGYMKPNPRAYQLILEENNLSAKECVYFDDSASNVAAAAKLGIRSYLYESPEQVRKILEGT